jgi:hypothetical protein
MAEAGWRFTHRTSSHSQKICRSIAEGGDLFRRGVAIVFVLAN